MVKSKTHKRPNFEWADTNVYPKLRARANWGDQGRCLPNMGRVSPGDGASGLSRVVGGGLFWCSQPALLIFHTRAALRHPASLYYIHISAAPGAGCWYYRLPCYFQLARPFRARGNALIDPPLTRVGYSLISS